MVGRRSGQMFWDNYLEVRTPRGVFELVLGDFRLPLGPFARRIATPEETERAWFFFRANLEHPFWSRLGSVLNLHAKLTGERLVLRGNTGDRPVIRLVLREFEQALRTGRLHFELVPQPEPTSLRQPEYVRPDPTPPPKRQAQPARELFHFEVRLVDESDAALCGMEVLFSWTGRKEHRTTNGAGIASCDVPEGSAAQVDVAARPTLTKILEDRWNRVRAVPRERWVKPGANTTVVEYCTDQPLPSVSVKPEVPHTVSYQPKSTWFEVTVVDELAVPVDGLGVVFDVMGAQQKEMTDGGGRARVELPAASAAASVTFANMAEVRDKLYARWEQCRKTDWKDPAPEDAVLQLPAEESLAPVTVEREKSRRIVLQPRVVLARLLGMWFDTSKCFLLPTARPTLPRLQGIYDRNPNTHLLVVGHTDRAGKPSYNDPLSLERAESILAYLLNDVEAWYAWYDASKPHEKRWSSHEDQLMILALGSPQGKDPVRWYQETRGLKVDGLAGSETRHRLIREYMDLDRTTLPSSITPAVHGCGENHPVVETADGQREQANRRVELLFFDSPVLPPAPGQNSGPDSPEYPEWVLRAKETYEFDPDDHLIFDIRLHDMQRTPMTNVAYRVSAIGVEIASGISSDGWIKIDVAGGSTDSVDCEWGEPREDGSYPHHRRIRVNHDTGTERDQAAARLHNLGYAVDSDIEYEAAVRCFQDEYQIPEDGLVGGELPSQTKAKLWLIYETDCDASTGDSASTDAHASDTDDVNASAP